MGTVELRYIVSEVIGDLEYLVVDADRWDILAYDVSFLDADRQTKFSCKYSQTCRLDVVGLLQCARSGPRHRQTTIL